MTLTLATFLILLASAVVFIAVSLLIRQLLAEVRRRLSTPLSWPELSVDRYRPMFRLLEDDDIRFLRSQPGASPALVNRLRRQRYQVFQGYLSSLQRDFQQACETLIHLAIHSHTDRQDIVRALVVSQAKFSLGVFRVRCRLVLYRWDVGQEPVARLVRLFEGLQLELLALTPETDAA
jgi:hypothetical protein